ncbi:VOC family protein [Flavobacterium azooxidireducens]|uniref:Bleomycin resistance protein n=1 Tax=Flavobacterium azooxidireducens TaxID=1871076 RepID=A0ABY4KCW3_9FLAO|nr:VOC family protein [Flavobacterium azooxidireducens]UPQ78627.1 VOC family protein [Flavobacterium azooxidireducens]
MLTAIHPKLPMRDKTITIRYYTEKLGFKIFGSHDYPEYLMVEKDSIQIHFFLFADLDPEQNYGQVYLRVNQIDNFYQTLLDNKVRIHPNGLLEKKPWGQREFSLLDPDSNLLTFGEG